MENIFVAEGNTGYTSVNGVLFNKNITTLVTYPTGKKGTTYQIPEGVTEISVYSFGGAANRFMLRCDNFGKVLSERHRGVALLKLQ